MSIYKEFYKFKIWYVMIIVVIPINNKKLLRLSLWMHISMTSIILYVQINW
jgi:hypothetical protein